MQSPFFLDEDHQSDPVAGAAKALQEAPRTGSILQRPSVSDGSAPAEPKQPASPSSSRGARIAGSLTGLILHGPRRKSTSVSMSERRPPSRGSSLSVSANSTASGSEMAVCSSPSGSATSLDDAEPLKPAFVRFSECPEPVRTQQAQRPPPRLAKGNPGSRQFSTDQLRDLAMLQNARRRVGPLTPTELRQKSKDEINAALRSGAISRDDLYGHAIF